MAKRKHEPVFQNLLDVLARRPTPRPVLFEFIINAGHLQRLAGGAFLADGSPLSNMRNFISAFDAAGYDYAVVPPWDAFVSFPGVERKREASVGMAHGGVIKDRTSFEAYPWQDPEKDDWSILERLEPHVPSGMKLVIFSNSGVLENLVELIGYEDLCFLLEDDPELVRDVADAIGSRLLRFYQRSLEHPIIGAAMVNDDWGFKTQPFLAPQRIREFIAPWHRRMVAAIHGAGRPAMLHSCGELKLLWEDLIEDIRYDGKHSYEDSILPVEEAYEKYGSRIAILGGIDMDFLCRATPQEIYRRSRAMIERTAARGGYALGSGNSIPDYVPAENFDAMRRAALDA
jgi:uroporphyrinogen decarboxylase